MFFVAAGTMYGTSVGVSFNVAMLLSGASFSIVFQCFVCLLLLSVLCSVLLSVLL